MAEIHLLTREDIPAVMRLNRAANWNQLDQDWRRIIQLEPQGCFGLSCDGRIVATATTICYGRRLAWIGMVLTDPDYRRRGFGRLVTERAIQYAEECQVDWIKLDATDLGRPIYLELGFVNESPVERWTAAISEGREVAPTAGTLSIDSALDLAAFGANRTELLAALGTEGAVSSPAAYAMVRPGANAFSIGPCVARTPEAAREVISGVLARQAGPFFWDLLPGNRHAVRLAEEFGFVPARKLVRMVRRGSGSGEPLNNDDSLVYAAAGFEYG